MEKVKDNMPTRKYVKSEKKMVSIRVPSDLIAVLNEIADKKGWPFTDLVVTVLDQYAQQAIKSKSRR